LAQLGAAISKRATGFGIATDGGRMRAPLQPSPIFSRGLLRPEPASRRVFPLPSRTAHSLLKSAPTRSQPERRWTTIWLTRRSACS